MEVIWWSMLSEHQKHKLPWVFVRGLDCRVDLLRADLKKWATVLGSKSHLRNPFPVASMLVFEQMAEQVLGILVRESWNPADHSWYTEFFLNGNMDVQHDDVVGTTLCLIMQSKAYKYSLKLFYLLIWVRFILNSPAKWFTTFLNLELVWTLALWTCS